VCVQFVLHNVTEPRPVDPDMPVIVTEVPKQKISLVPFISALRKFRYIHIRLLDVWGIALSHDDIVALVRSFSYITLVAFKHYPVWRLNCRLFFAC